MTPSQLDAACSDLMDYAVEEFDRLLREAVIRQGVKAGEFRLTALELRWLIGGMTGGHGFATFDEKGPLIVPSSMSNTYARTLFGLPVVIVEDP